MGEEKGLPVGDVSSQAASVSPCLSSSRAVPATAGTRERRDSSSVQETVGVPFWAGLYLGKGPSGDAHMCVRT